MVLQPKAEEMFAREICNWSGDFGSAIAIAIAIVRSQLIWWLPESIGPFRIGIVAFLIIVYFS